jgi:hypothetical protein
MGKVRVLQVNGRLFKNLMAELFEINMLSYMPAAWILATLSKICLAHLEGSRNRSLVMK